MGTVEHGRAGNFQVARKEFQEMGSCHGIVEEKINSRQSVLYEMFSCTLEQHHLAFPESLYYSRRVISLHIYLHNSADSGDQFSS